MNTLDPSLLAPAFVAGLLVLVTHVPLGLQVLARGIVFIDLAIAQLAALGVLGAELAGWEAHGLAMQLVAVGAALLGGFVLTQAERRWPEVQEALIGVLFVLAASAGILLVVHNPHGGEHLQDMLAGQILWVGWSQVAALAGVTAVLAGVLYLGRRSRARFLFYGVFGCAVTASVQMVGVYLVFASLIVPALAVRHLPKARAVPLGLACGAAGYALGLAASALWDLPAGAVIVWALAACALALAWRLRR
ncbi:metal ABC transporter permease [Thiobacter aerophilum]|uniref:Metal ABC transporter permease n=1 Tax=Thiobacter aerophilum TaxID=3121275 RepID=A0ABV0EIX6_9BURK